ncbi:hypothetical protein HYFRA_00000341 [Hymenoscyphus fraxineus]|uniref:SAP domain-containing protein n=1 Tax=Hymenoscyphus fraxineus TaxID=746836 RepID=A0A9N9PWN9_9HELO|nr:hypothetical protein HYFRA_00000341 [Hymenoscyphus fraxineus]
MANPGGQGGMVFDSLSVADLRQECEDRGLEIWGSKEELLTRLDAYYGVVRAPTNGHVFNDLLVKDLRAQCKDRHISTGGTKPVLIERLDEYEWEWRHSRETRLVDLKAECKKFKLKGYSSLRKEQLIQRLDEYYNYRRPGDIPPPAPNPFPANVPPNPFQNLPIDRPPEIVHPVPPPNPFQNLPIDRPPEIVHPVPPPNPFQNLPIDRPPEIVHPVPAPNPFPPNVPPNPVSVPVPAAPITLFDPNQRRTRRSSSSLNPNRALPPVPQIVLFPAPGPNHPRRRRLSVPNPDTPFLKLPPRAPNKRARSLLANPNQALPPLSPRRPPPYPPRPEDDPYQDPITGHALHFAQNVASTSRKRPRSSTGNNEDGDAPSSSKYVKLPNEVRVAAIPQQTQPPSGPSTNRQGARGSGASAPPTEPAFRNKRFVVRATRLILDSKRNKKEKREIISAFVDQDFKSKEYDGKVVAQYAPLGSGAGPSDDWMTVEDWVEFEKDTEAGEAKGGEKAAQRSGWRGAKDRAEDGSSSDSSEESDPESREINPYEGKPRYDVFGGEGTTEEWFASEPQWEERVGAGTGHRWRGTKYLQTRSNGTGFMGLWEREPLEEGENDRNTMGGIPTGIDKLVVKQLFSGIPRERYEREIGFHDQLTKTGSKHIVAKYGSDEVKLKSNKSSQRIFMEYCENGNFRRFMKLLKRERPITDPLSEEFCWRYLECLASALAIMEHGNEDEAGPSWDTPLIHNDINEDTIMAGTTDSEQHTRTLALKLMEFGKTRVYDRRVENDETTGTSRGSGSGETRASKRALADTNRRATSATNVWQMGRMFSKVITRDRIEAEFEENSAIKYMRQSAGEDHVMWWGDPQTDRPRRSRKLRDYEKDFFLLKPDIHASPTRFIMTMGKSVLKAPYSVTLRCVVLKMLAYEQRDRITSRELLKVCRDSLRILRAADRQMEEIPINLPSETSGLESGERSGGETSGEIKRPPSAQDSTVATSPSAGHDQGGDQPVSPPVVTHNDQIPHLTPEEPPSIDSILSAQALTAVASPSVGLDQGGDQPTSPPVDDNEPLPIDSIISAQDPTAVVASPSAGHDQGGDQPTSPPVDDNQIYHPAPDEPPPIDPIISAQDPTAVASSDVDLDQGGDQPAPPPVPPPVVTQDDQISSSTPDEPPAIGSMIMNDLREIGDGIMRYVGSWNFPFGGNR